MSLLILFNVHKYFEKKFSYVFPGQVHWYLRRRWRYVDLCSHHCWLIITTNFDVPQQYEGWTWNQFKTVIVKDHNADRLCCPYPLFHISKIAKLIAHLIVQTMNQGSGRWRIRGLGFGSFWPNGPPETQRWRNDRQSWMEKSFRQ